jgi:hypothetical protein
MPPYLVSLPRCQWLFPGMVNEEVEKAFDQRISNTGGNPSFKSPAAIYELRQQRRLAAQATVGPSKL